MKKVLFYGVCVALATPITNGKVDYVALDRLIDHIIDGQVDAIVLMGTTGEGYGLSDKEQKAIIAHCIEYIDRRVVVIVGASGSVKSIADRAKFAAGLGANGLLVLSPYYNKCPQDGIVRYYKDIASKTDMPIIVYNVPSRTGVNIEPKTLTEISKIKNVCGIKEASGNISQIQEIFSLLSDTIAIYSGDDLLNYLFYSLGASGCISVCGNVYPKLEKLLFEYTKAYKNCSRVLNSRLYNFHKSMFIEPNPIPLKYALSKKKFGANEISLPLLPFKSQHHQAIDDAMIELDSYIKDNYI